MAGDAGLTTFLSMHCGTNQELTALNLLCLQGISCWHQEGVPLISGIEVRKWDGIFFTCQQMSIDRSRGWAVTVLLEGAACSLGLVSLLFQDVAWLIFLLFWKKQDECILTIWMKQDECILTNVFFRFSETFMRAIHELISLFCW